MKVTDTLLIVTDMPRGYASLCPGCQSFHRGYASFARVIEFSVQVCQFVPGVFEFPLRVYQLHKGDRVSRPSVPVRVPRYSSFLRRYASSTKVIEFPIKMCQFVPRYSSFPRGYASSAANPFLLFPSNLTKGCQVFTVLVK